MLSELGYTQSEPQVIFTDSANALVIALNPFEHELDTSIYDTNRSLIRLGRGNLDFTMLIRLVKLLAVLQRDC